MSSGGGSNLRYLQADNFEADGDFTSYKEADDKAEAPEDEMVVKEPEHYSKKALGRNRNMKRASSCREREASRLRIRQEKALHLDGPEKGPDATHVRGTYYEEKGDLMSVLMLDEKISPQVMNNSCVSCKCSHRINISGSENSAASDHDPLQQAHPLETTTAHVLPPCGGSTVEELLVLAFECLLKKARNT
ncbi:unnamed protein product [Brassica oleracea var. botrytis]|nr:unnamed protein product [Brassica oleracea]